ncbi:hypothetical protein KSP40_PGU021809 [Platanthera guangdongensis]|uniref:Uncharacterized protein n=1 Tax=Platanthera guangdongensis TaxID=2320717 RepID=A0ABR2MEZ4_9ASPA
MGEILVNEPIYSLPAGTSLWATFEHLGHDQKKFHEQFSPDQEAAAFGSRISPVRVSAPKKAVTPRANGSGSNGSLSRRLSLNQGANSNGTRSGSKDGKRDSPRPSAPVNYVAISKEDASFMSSNDPVPVSP